MDTIGHATIATDEISQYGVREDPTIVVRRIVAGSSLATMATKYGPLEGQIEQ
jgi:hypothetical protein